MGIRTACAGVLVSVSLLISTSAGSGTSRVVLVRPDASAISVDLDGDGVAERVSFHPRQTPAVSVQARNGVRSGVVPGRWLPWKVILADVDGDTKLEIAVGVHKATRYLRRPHHCLFVYRWDGALQPLWLGSSLSRPFTDFTLVSCPDRKAASLFALEKTPDGRLTLAEYRWNGFGFTLRRRTGAWNTARFEGSGANSPIVLADGQRQPLECCRAQERSTKRRRRP